VVEAGVTLFDVRLVTEPMPWSMEILVAPVTLQVRVADCPAIMAAGVAINELITGDDGGVVVPAGVVAVALDERPELLPAASCAVIRYRNVVDAASGESVYAVVAVLAR
jgi:hypothetical protein